MQTEEEEQQIDLVCVCVCVCKKGERMKERRGREKRNSIFPEGSYTDLMRSFYKLAQAKKIIHKKLRRKRRQRQATAHNI